MFGQDPVNIIVPIIMTGVVWLYYACVRDIVVDNII